MGATNSKSLVVGMGTGWERDTASKAGPISEPIADEAFRLAVDEKSPLIFLSGNGGGDEEMPEADRMQNYVSALVHEILKGDDTRIVVPEIYTDTFFDDLEYGIESPYEFMPSTSTSRNIQNLVRFIRIRAGKEGVPIPDVVHVVALDAHMSRVLAIIRKAFKKAGFVNVVVTPHEINGEELYSSRNGQIRLRNGLVFLIWTKISHLWSLLNGDAGI